MDTEFDPLDQLLSVVAAAAEAEKLVVKTKEITKVNEDEFFLSKIAAHELKVLDTSAVSHGKKSKQTPSSSENKLESKKSTKFSLSLIHTGDTDSSDDEANRNYENSKYNECGREIKHLFPEEKPKSEFANAVASSWKQKRVAPPKDSIAPLKFGLGAPKKEENIMHDPFFGLRISKPLISSAVLQERMSGRAAVSMARVKTFTATIAPNQDWVIAGAIVQKSNVRTSQNGAQYIIWTLSDLQNDLLTVSVFLFKNAYKELWKTSVGTVVGILNPSVLDNRDGKQQATLSVDNHQKVMIFGQSKDYGLCKSKKKDGEQCTSFVNINRCTYCIYHVKKEYQKCSMRSELQSKFAGGGLQNLRNKVLGKNEVFYAGKSYMATKPAKKSKKLLEKDNKRLLDLSRDGVTISAPVVTKRKGVAASFESTRAQRMRDMQMLQKLNGSTDICYGLDSKKNFNKDELSSEVTFEESRKAVLDVIAKVKSKNGGNKLNIFDQNEISTNTLEESNEFLVTENSEELFKDKTPNKINKTSRVEPKLTQLNKDSEPSTSKINTDNTEQRNTSSTFVPKLSNPEKENKVELDNTPKQNKNDLLKSKSLINNPNKDSEPSTSKINTDNTEQRNTSSTFVPKLSNPEKENKVELDKTTKQNKNGSLKSKSLINNPNKDSEPSTSKINTDNTKQRNKSSNFVPKLSNPEKENKVELNKTSKENKIQSKSLINIPNLDVESIVDVTKLKIFKNLQSQPSPKLSHNGNFMIDLNSPVNKKVDRAKINALQWVHQNGPIKKDTPNGTKKSGVKRFLESTEENEQETKKSKLEEQAKVSQRFRKIMEMTSKHADLLEQRDNEEQDKYFNKLEMREKMEEKMMSTYKVQCKAVKCLNCKYTSFSAADRCKAEKHVLKVFDAMKRFFKCGNCGNRTVALEICPMFSCKQCGSSKWERTTMMKEKKAHVGEALSIRGGEQTFVNSVTTDANINLLVPED